VLTSCCKTNFSVILNGVKDLEPVEKIRFFAPLRMTRSRGLGFCNSFEAFRAPPAVIIFIL
jgi:hypothetical protein